MELPFFYTEQLSDNDLFTLSEETSRHVVQVLRMKPQELLKLTDGKGQYLVARILDNNKKKCTVQVAERHVAAVKERNVSICISLLENPSRLEWFLEKATEMGVSKLQPLVCERTYKDTFRFDRMKNILVAAMLQSQQYWLPELEVPEPFQKVVISSTYPHKFIAHCEPGQRGVLTASHASQVLIGPEGDFTRYEIDLALANGYSPVMLGATRLRTETAGMVAAALLCTAEL